MDLIWVTWKAIYFWPKDWTGSISLSGFEKFADWRVRIGPSQHTIRSRFDIVMMSNLAHDTQRLLTARFGMYWHGLDGSMWP
jgi:hypothetical protein